MTTSAPQALLRVTARVGIAAEPSSCCVTDQKDSRGLLLKHFVVNARPVASEPHYEVNLNKATSDHASEAQAMPSNEIVCV